jgi:hypothetical protein
MDNVSQSSAPIMYCRVRVPSMSAAGKLSSIGPGQLEKAFREATAQGGDTVTVAAEELGIYYTITKSKIAQIKHDFIVTVYYAESCPICRIYIDWHSLRYFSEIETIKSSVKDFANQLDSILKRRYGIPAYIDCLMLPNDKGMSLLVIGANSGTVLPLTKSLNAALAHFATKVQMRVVDGQEEGHE